MYGSYSYNLWGAASENFTLGLGVTQNYGNPYLVGPPHSESQVVAPSEMYAIMDTREIETYAFVFQWGPNWVWMGSGWSGFDWTSSPMVSSVDTNATGPLQHGKAFNVLFCDGHVAAVLVSNLNDPEITARNWNVDYQPHPELWLGVRPP